MKNIVAISMAAVTAFSPLTSFANDEFATVEASQYYEGLLITTSLYAVGQQEPVDGTYSFEGLSLANGRTVPIRINVPVELGLSQDLPDQLRVEDVELALVDQFAFETDSAFVHKYFYSSADGSESNIVLTDDPIPLAVWLLVAGAAAISAPIAACLYADATSDGNEQQILEGEVTVGEEGIRIGVSCEF
ncbi:hypothetical protein V6617_10945 [Pelagibacterium nitratireducens]|jgi:hypothetical protein|uniref:Uncharacterized protein n=1 Tax=Pelagibacterium nitratireducens TaxID=1046114 RepID=A0ABZ2HY90_9HYPH|tara:strand:+ start:12641 stop:13210 length:570 start_codon:yes stop_codon:yes gene_type:complete